jgi:hypothetical protein
MDSKGNEMTKFFVSETLHVNCQISGRVWHECNAANLDDAKKVAEAAQEFAGTTIWVGIQNIEGDDVTPVAVKDDGDEWYGYFVGVAL